MTTQWSCCTFLHKRYCENNFVRESLPSVLACRHNSVLPHGPSYHRWSISVKHVVFYEYIISNLLHTHALSREPSTSMVRAQVRMETMKAPCLCLLQHTPRLWGQMPLHQRPSRLRSGRSDRSGFSALAYCGLCTLRQPARMRLHVGAIRFVCSGAS